MPRCRIKKCEKTLCKVLQVAVIYIIFAAIATVFCVLFPSDTTNANVAFFVGVSGTLASLYSIIVSARDEIRSEKESLENKTFLAEISKKVDFLQSDTKTVHANLKDFVNIYFQSNIPSTEDECGDSKNDKTAKDNWGNPDDEKPPT